MTLRRALLAWVAGSLAGGGALWLAGMPGWADLVWALGVAAVLAPLTIGVARDLWHRDFGVDVIALLAMGVALLLGEYLAGIIVGLMLVGGESLEDYAGSRARRDLSALLERAPRFAHRISNDEVNTVGIEEVRPADLILVRAGEVVPVDAAVAEGVAVIDEASLTGEPLPVRKQVGDRVLSGTVNAGDAFRARAVATAEDSAYTGIIRLVEQAKEAKTPLTRLADSYAVVFLPLTLAVASLAWLLSGDPVRALAVLVVATPCPLILAAPVAVVSGVSRAARRGVVVKGGGALEALGKGGILLLDKTGTLTVGTPQVSRVETFGELDADELLRLTASADQASAHVLAAALVASARDAGLQLSFPADVREDPGTGLEATVDGRRIRLGRLVWALGSAPPARARELRRRASIGGSSCVFVSVDGAAAGAILLDDPLRADAPTAVRALRQAGFHRVVLVSGDHPDAAETVGAAIGADMVLAERSPAEKVEAVHEARDGAQVVMVGDGINDAPALAAADVGVALGARGATASSEAADIVITVDRLDRLAEAATIARRSRRIALQSILAGMGMSGVAMGFAAVGMLGPVAGALLQEGIDVAVILNALRALRSGRSRATQRAAPEVSRWLAEHSDLAGPIAELRALADQLDELEPEALRRRLDDMRRFLIDELVPHERGEEETAFPLVAAALGGADPTGAMARAHLEIAHLARLFGRLVDELPPEGPAPEDLRDLRRVLYGLHAVLRLHIAQEEEAYRVLVTDEGAASVHAAGRGDA